MLAAALLGLAPATAAAAQGAGSDHVRSGGASEHVPSPTLAGDRRALAAELAAAGPERLATLQAELAHGHRATVARLAAGGSWTPDEIAAVVAGLLVEPDRFAAESGFRERVVPAIAAALPPGAPTALRDRLLVELSGRAGLLDLAPVELAWGAAERGLLDRLVGAAYGRPPASSVESPWPEMGLGPAEAPIGLSIYSLASPFFSTREAAEFLGAVRRWAPERALVVLADHPQAAALAETASRLGVHLVPTWGRTYSPWPRDPMSFLVEPDGSQVAVLRPNRQPGREADADMGLELVQDLPAALDARFGPLAWTVAPVPFHNGNLIDGGEVLWLSIHTLEPRILELLKLDRVPEASFFEPSGVRRYVETARMAAGEMARLFGKPVRFVHPLPVAAGAGESGQERGAGAAGASDRGAEAASEGVGARGSGRATAALDGAGTAELAAAMRRLGGGAGFDLDSVVTLLPSAGGGPAALVGDLAAGRELIAASADDELERWSTAYGVARAAGGRAEALRSAIDRSHRGARAAGLAAFLELIARHLATEGFEVRRLPLVLVPTALLERAGDYPDPDFLVGWNNVVVEVAGDRLRAEGFANLLETGDARARALFAELGYELELLPPLVESVLRNGGYRCASNHLREAARAGDD